MSAVTLLARLVMIGAIYTSIGPTPRVGLVLLGVSRLYWMLKKVGANERAGA